VIFAIKISHRQLLVNTNVTVDEEWQSASTSWMMLAETVTAILHASGENGQE
jgi:hypothetical protein